MSKGPEWRRLWVQGSALYLGRSEEADGLQVFHVVSVLGVDALEQVDLLLQDLRLSVDHTHYAGLCTRTHTHTRDYYI